PTSSCARQSLRCTSVPACGSSTSERPISIATPDWTTSWPSSSSVRATYRSRCEDGFRPRKCYRAGTCSSWRREPRGFPWGPGGDGGGVAGHRHLGGRRTRADCASRERHPRRARRSHRLGIVDGSTARRCQSATKAEGRGSGPSVVAVHARAPGGGTASRLTRWARSPFQAAGGSSSRPHLGVTKPEVSAVIVAWNAGTALATCAGSLRAAALRADTTLQLVVVDNVSTDGAVDELGLDDGDVQIRNPLNAG